MTSIQLWLAAKGGVLPKESEDAYAERVTFMHNRSESYRDKRSMRSSKTKGIATNPSFNAKVGAAVRIHFQKETGKKPKKTSSIIDSKDGGPRFGKLYLLKWTTPGYGRPKTRLHWAR